MRTLERSHPANLARISIPAAGAAETKVEAASAKATTMAFVNMIGDEEQDREVVKRGECVM